MVMYFLSFLLEEWTSMILCSPSSLHLLQQHCSPPRLNCIYQVDFSNEPIKSLTIMMLIPIMNYLNITFHAACVPHVANICDAAVSPNECFQNHQTLWASRAFKHWADSDGKHVVLLLNNVSGHNNWHSHINLHQTVLISPQHIATRFAPGQTARLRWMRAAQVLQNIFI